MVFIGKRKFLLILSYSTLMKRKILTGSQFSKGTILGASVVLGSISLLPNASLAMDGEQKSSFLVQLKASLTLK